MRIRMSGAVVCVFLALTACSVLDDFKSGLRITIEDPHRRLGRPPWTIAAFNPYLGPEEKLAFWAKGKAAPGKDYVVLPGFDDLTRLRDNMPWQEMDFGLALPALRPDGYFLARVVWTSNASLVGTSVDGKASFCRWGEIESDAGAESVEFQVRLVRKGGSSYAGFEYQIAVRIPEHRATGST